MEIREKPRHGRAYLLQRAREERRSAALATCDEARIAPRIEHRKLARCYAADACEARLYERRGESGERATEKRPKGALRCE